MFTFKSAPYLGAAVCVALLSSCATTEGEPKLRGVAALKGDVRLGGQTDRICFNRNIDGFSNAKNDTVVVSAAGNKDYLLEMFGNCSNLRNAQSLGLDSTGMCLRQGDHIIVSQSAFSLTDSGGIGPQRCSIKSIYAWDKKAKG